MLVVRSSQGQHPAKLLFGQCQLAQSDLQTLVTRCRVATPHMQLHGQPRSGDRVPDRVSHPARELAQQSCPLGLYELGLQVSQARTEIVYAVDQVVNLVLVVPVFFNRLLV